MLAGIKVDNGDSPMRRRDTYARLRVIAQTQRISELFTMHGVQ